MLTTARIAMAMRSAMVFADRMSFMIAENPKPSLGRGYEHFLDVFPIHQVIEEGFDVIGPSVAIVDVIGVFPNIAAENRRSAMNERVLAVRSLSDGQFAVLYHEPSPAGSELGHTGLREIFLHLGDAAEVGIDFGLQLAGNLIAAAVRLHPLPEVRVIVMLTSIVEEAGILAEGAFHDLLERFTLQPAANQQLVAVIDIGLVVLVVVIFERLARHVGRQRRSEERRVGKEGRSRWS